MAAERKNVVVGAAAVAAVLIIAGAAYLWRDVLGLSRGGAGTASAQTRPSDSATAAAPAGPDTVVLTYTQLASVKVEAAAEREFPNEKQAVGSIDFDEDMTVPVFTPYQGRIVGLFAKVGDDVNKGQTLFTIDSPDLLQAESA